MFQIQRDCSPQVFFFSARRSLLPYSARVPPSLLPSLFETLSHVISHLELVLRANGQLHGSCVEGQLGAQLLHHLLRVRACDTSGYMSEEHSSTPGTPYRPCISSPSSIPIENHCSAFRPARIKCPPSKSFARSGRGGILSYRLYPLVHEFLNPRPSQPTIAMSPHHQSATCAP